MMSDRSSHHQVKQSFPLTKDIKPSNQPPNLFTREPSLSEASNWLISPEHGISLGWGERKRCI
jgi:hypothetical protein